MKQALVEDENSIKKYFEMYAKADFEDEDIRNRVLEYFVDKIYVYNDRLVITGYYSDDETSIYLDALTEVSSSGTDKRAKSSTSLLSAPCVVMRRGPPQVGGVLMTNCGKEGPIEDGRIPYHAGRRPRTKFV